MICLKQRVPYDHPARVRKWTCPCRLEETAVKHEMILFSSIMECIVGKLQIRQVIISLYGFILGTGLLCFGNTSLTNEKSADEVINAVFNFLDSFNKSYDTIPLFTLFRTPLYTQFEESYNIIKT